MEAREAVAARYEAAVRSLTEKLEKDRNVLAVVLFGSLAYDTVWEKSDIDLMVVVDENAKSDALTLLEDGIVVHASVTPRSEFRRRMLGSVQGSFADSMLVRSRLLFTRDASLQALWDERPSTIGERDRRVQLLRAGIGCLPVRVKAEKWLRVKRDNDYATLYLLFTAEALARIEIFDAAQNPGREVLQQAMALNPAFFGTVYPQLLHGPRDTAHLEAVLGAVDDYLDARTDRCFGPVLEFLDGWGGPCGARELNQHFERQMGVQGVDLACDWLAERGHVEAVGLPVRLTKDSRVSVDEVAYHRPMGMR